MFDLHCRYVLLAALALLIGPAPAATDTPLSPGQVFKSCHVCPEMRVIPAGSFTMGAAPAELARIHAAGGLPPARSPEGPRHRVAISGFAAARHAVTRGEFAAFVGVTGYTTDAERGDKGCRDLNGFYVPAHNWRRPGNSQQADHPVVCVSWHDAQAYATWISQVSGQHYRLLTEAEREYAARAGTSSAYWWGDDINTDQANYNDDPAMNGSPVGRRQSTVPATSFQANPFGLYNVHGNVWEWVADCYHASYQGAPGDGSAWTRDCAGTGRVLRGGSWMAGPLKASSAYRVFNEPHKSASDTGFRLAMTLAR